MSSHQRVVVLFGGRSAEHSVSCVSARNVLAAMDTSCRAVDVAGIDEAGEWRRSTAAEAWLAGATPDLAALAADGEKVEPLATLRGADEMTRSATVVLPLLHGPHGEDGTIQGLCEVAGVAYAGPDVLGAALTMDKAAARAVAAAAGIPQPAHLVVWPYDSVEPAWCEFAFAELGSDALFVKPANMGSSIGVSRATTPAELAEAVAEARRYDEVVVVEEGIVGREIEIGVIGDYEAAASVAGEIRPAADFYDFEDKYVDGAAELIIPADLSESEAAELEQFALTAYSALRCQNLARVDVFLESPGRGFLLNEINTIPGFTEISMFPRMWGATGLSYTALIDRLLELAVSRHERRRRRGMSASPVDCDTGAQADEASSPVPSVSAPD